MNLKVTDEVRRHALAQIWAESQKCAGGRVFYQDLAGAWRGHTGLRQDDLMRAVSELWVNGGLAVQDSPQGRVLELTKGGARRLDGLSVSPVAMLRRALALWTLARARSRTTSVPATFTLIANRRLSDTALRS